MKKNWNKVLVLFILFILNSILFSNPINDESIVKISILGIFKPTEIIVTDSNGIKQEYHLNYLNEKKLIFFEKDFTLEIKNKIKRRYTGKLEIIPLEHFLLLVNYVSIKDYIASVIVSEIGSSSLEALKAQAVLSRSLAYKSIQSKHWQDYHLSDLTDSQVYKGLDSITKRSRSAVFETSEILLLYKQNIAEIFYSSTCGGQTSLPKDVWLSAEDLGYQSVSCSFADKQICAHSPHFHWTWQTNLDQLGAALGIKNLSQIQIIKRDSAGRIMQLVFKDSASKEIFISGSEFHRMIGKYYKKWNLIKSTKFDLRIDDQLVFITGNGLGHGVGLCQYGARKLAEMNWDYKKILKFYYPLFEIGKQNLNE